MSSFGQRALTAVAVLWAWGSVAGTGCYVGAPDGDGDDTADDPAAEACGGVVPLQAPLRRITATQLANTVRSLFGRDFDLTGFPASQRVDHGYSTDAQANVVSELGAQQIFDLSESIAAQVTTDLDFLLPCAAASADAACLDAFVDAFGPRAFRRPLSAEERATMTNLHRAAPSDAAPAERVQMLVSAFLVSPQFLYITQGGGEPSEKTAPDGSPLLRRTDHEIAARLSYLLWEAMPDEALFAAADAQELHTAEQVRSAARRMLDDARAEATVARFHAEWMRVENVRSAQKSGSAYPQFDAALADAMAQETERFVVRTVLHGGGSYADLMAGSRTEVTQALADLYGIEVQVPEPQGWVEAEYPPTRAGLLTQASALAVRAGANASNPIRRGDFVQTDVLCQTIYPPPPGIPGLSEPAAGQTRREVLAQHRANPVCAGCHDFIDPPGLAFENFDGVGAWRERENGVEIDPSGELLLPSGDSLGRFDDAAQLVHLIADSEVGSRCYAQQWLHYVSGSAPGEEHSCAVDGFAAASAEADGNVRELIVDLVASAGFRHRFSE